MAIPEWAEGLYYNNGMFSEILVYHDDEAIYFEHRGKESGIVRFTFEMLEGLKIVEDEEETANSSEFLLPSLPLQLSHCSSNSGRFFGRGCRCPLF